MLHVVPGVAPRYGGPSEAVFTTCKALQREGHETLVATTDADGAGGRIQVELGVPLDYRGVKTIFFRRDVSEAFKYSRRLAIWLHANVACFDVVELHAVFSHSSLAGASACRSRHVPYVVRPLGSLSSFGLSRRRLAKAVLVRLGVRKMLAGAARIHFATEREKRLAEEALGIGHGVVVPLAVDIDELHQSVKEPAASLVPKGTPYVIALGRLHPVKGLETLMQAFLQVTEAPDLRQWRLVLAGQGDARYLRRLQQLAGPATRLVFPGWLAASQKGQALSRAELFAMPSVHENFGISAVEAMAMGVPVVVSPEVGLADLVEASCSGWVVERTREQWARCLSGVLRDPGARRARGDNGRELAHSRFTPAVLAAELGRLFREVIGDRRRDVFPAAYLGEDKLSPQSSVSNVER